MTDYIQIYTAYETGQLPASKAYVKLRSLVSELQDMIKDIEADVVDELLRYGSEDLVVEGNKISHVKGRATFDYKQCDLWTQTNNERKRIEQLIKTASTQKVEIVDKETGEIIEPVEIKNGKGYLKLEKA